MGKLYFGQYSSRLKTVLKTIQKMQKMNCTTELKEVALKSHFVEARVAVVEQMADEDTLTYVLLNNNDPAVHLAALRRIQSQETLGRIAGSTKLETIRRMALERITDDVGWISVVMTTNDREIEASALARITDPEAIKKVACSVSEYNVMTVIMQLTDQMTLAALAIKHCKSNAGEAAVKKLSDPMALELVAVECHASQISQLAMTRISSEEAFQRIAATAKDLDVRKAAVRNISDPACLMKIILTPKEYMIREQALQQLKDQDMLEKVAMASEELKFCLDATEKIQNQEVLLRIAQNHHNSTVSNAAFQKLTDEALLTAVAVAERSWLLKRRLAAIDRIHDQEKLMEIINQAKDQEVRLKAMENIKLNEQPAQTQEGDGTATIQKSSGLDPTANTAPDQFSPDPQAEAQTHVSDQELAVRLALSHDDGTVRRASVQRVITQDDMAHFALTDTNDDVCFAAIEKLEDQELLENVAMKSTSGFVKLAAYKKLYGADSETAKWIAVFLPTNHMKRDGVSRREKRTKAALELVRRLSADPYAARIFWGVLVEGASGSAHHDVITEHHAESSGRSSDCSHSDNFSEHTDYGTNLKLPPYPQEE